MKYGEAYGRLPMHEPRSREQERFLDKAVLGLADDDRVVSLRLSVFADMLRSRPWTVDALQDAGGAEGVGVEFLEQTFGRRTSAPAYRRHKQAARLVLHALLPKPASDIKGQLISRNALLQASGYSDRPHEFDELLRILDSEVRIITPSESPEPENCEFDVTENTEMFQLTHDFLVPSVREWLSKCQKETRRGRAELLLAERSAMWDRRRERKQLPGFIEFIRISLLAPASNRDTAERRMMAEARKYHSMRFLALFAVLCVLSYVVSDQYSNIRRRRAMDQLKVAEVWDLSRVMRQVPRGDRSTLEELRELAAHGTDREKLNASLALLPIDTHRASYVARRISEFDLREQELISRFLTADNVGELVATSLRDFLCEQAPGSDQQFRAGAALMQLDSDTGTSIFAEDPHELARLLTADFELSECRVLGRLLDETLEQYKRPLCDALINIVARQPELQLDHAGRISLGRQRAAAAATLLRMGDHSSPFTVFRVTHDPESLTQFVQGFRKRLDTPERLLRMFELSAKSSDALDRFGVLLSLGEYTFDDIPADERAELKHTIVDWYQSDPKSSVHSACGWLLRRWGFEDEATAIDQTEVPYSQGREWFVQRVSVGKETDVFLTFVVFHAGTFTMGESGLPDYATPHSERIADPFAILDREVSVRLAQTWMPDIVTKNRKQNPSDRHPFGGVNWDGAVRFCRWLTECVYGASDEYQCYVRANASDLEWSIRLEAKGFRLPQDAEWEYACRAGTRTAWSCGSDLNMLEHYGNYGSERTEQKISSNVCGTLRPNLRGLFDMNGNVKEWCNEKRPKASHVSRGGYRGSWAVTLRSGHSSAEISVDTRSNQGLRLVMTLPRDE